MSSLYLANYARSIDFSKTRASGIFFSFDLCHFSFPGWSNALIENIVENAVDLKKDVVGKNKMKVFFLIFVATCHGSFLKWKLIKLKEIK